MTLRRFAPLLLALLACQEELDRRPLRAVDYAVFDPSNSLIPLPNDLALASAQTMPDGAQKEFLLAFAAAGGFPNDQEVAITVDFTRALVDEAAGGEIVYEAPDLDLASLTADTVQVVKLVGTTPTPVPVDFAAATYVKGATRGTLTLRRAVNPATGKRNWDGGATYLVALRGGPDGVAVANGNPDGLQAQPTFYILRESALGDKALTDPENQLLLPGTKAEKAATAARLEPLRLSYQAPLAVLDAVAPFPASEIAVLSTFKVEAGTSVPVDAGSGTVPLPIDLLRDPTTGKVVENAAFGAAAKGLATLDGFSTTAMILASTTAPIDAATVNAATVSLYKLNGTAAPTKLADLATALATPEDDVARFVVEPPAITQDCTGLAASGRCAAAIALAPAVPAAVPGRGNFFLPPLEEGTEYAVVVTDGVKDAAGNPLRRSTFGKILLSVTSPVYVNGKSQLSGVSDAVAGQITLMKGKLAPVFAAVPDASKVAMAWTFRTQSIAQTSVQLSAAVYGATVNPAIVATAPVTDPTLGTPFMSTRLVTLDAIDPATGALKPNPATWAPAPVDALVAVPPIEALTEACPQDATLKCAPLVVFHHGLNGGRWQASALANTLLSNGFALAALDAPYHGARAFCSEDADCSTDGVAADGVCTPDAAKATQGDAVPPGTCTTGSLRFDPARGTTAASGNYFVSSNFFRIRDAIRQDLIDQSALVLALARPPTLPLPAGMANPFAEALATNGIGIDPTRIYYVGQSLGGIIGTNVLATNPRFSRGVLNVAGGTLVDVFTQGDAFQTQVDALFLGLGIDRSQLATNPAMAAQYLKTLNVAKWILDPADPINFAKHLVGAPLPDLLASPDGSVAQAEKEVFGQAANGDLVVENPFNLLLYEAAGIDWTMYVDADAAGNVVSHSFLSSSPEAQADVADWLLGLPYPGPQVTLP